MAEQGSGAHTVDTCATGSTETERLSAFDVALLRAEKQRPGQQKIVVPRVIDAPVIGKSAVYINGQIYKADTQGAQAGEVIKVANAGRPAAANYTRLTLLDETTIRLADDCNKAIQHQARATLQLAQRALGTRLEQDLEALNKMALSAVQSVRKSVVDVSNIAVVVNHFLEEERKIRDAEETLGINWDKPETTEPYNDLPVSQVWAIAEEIKRMDQAIASGRLSTDDLVRYLTRRADGMSISGKNKKRREGRPETEGYDLAFVRWHIKGTHTQKEAFEIYITEHNIIILDASDWDNRLKTFVASIQNRRRAYEKGDVKLFSRIGKLL